MSNTILTNAENVNCIYAGQSLSLFMDLRRRGEVTAMCIDSTIEDLPLVLNLVLQRTEAHLSAEAQRSLLSSSSHTVVARPRDDGGVGGEVVAFAMEGHGLLKMTVDLTSFAERSRQLAEMGPESPEHVLVHQGWDIGDAFSLMVQFRALADGLWPVLQLPQWSEVPSALQHSHPRPSATPRARAELSELAEDTPYFVEDSLARVQSTARSMTSRATRLFDPSEPRSQLQGPIFLDQTHFPVIHILFVPALFTRDISTPPNMVWDMAVHVDVQRSAARRTRRTGKERESKRESRRQHESVNVCIEEPMTINSSTWEDEVKTPRDFEALVLSFNADHRELPPDEVGRRGKVAYDVARATRLAVGDFTFDVLVTTKKRDEISLDEILRAVRGYHSEHDAMDVLEIDVEDLVNYVYERYAYMKVIPYFDGISFHTTVWEAVRLYMMNWVAEETDSYLYDDDIDDDGVALLNDVLAET